MIRTRQTAAALTMTLALGAAPGNVSDTQARIQWLNAWHCPTFKDVYHQPAVPRANNPHDAELVDVAGFDAKMKDASPLYSVIAYDAAHRIAYTLDPMDYPRVLQPAAPPPFPVLRADLSGIRLKSGIAIGTRASRVVAIMGRPSAQHGCGSELYTYALGPMHASILLTIHAGRVVRIDYWGDD